MRLGGVHCLLALFLLRGIRRAAPAQVTACRVVTVAIVTNLLFWWFPDSSFSQFWPLARTPFSLTILKRTSFLIFIILLTETCTLSLYITFFLSRPLNFIYINTNLNNYPIISNISPTMTFNGNHFLISFKYYFISFFFTF